MERVCENCAAPDDELTLVRRVYLDPDRPGDVKSVEDGAELWCLSCTTQYPHQLTEG